MKQMDLFTTSVLSADDTSGVVWKLYIDGASKNNPGPSGCGFVLMKNQEIVFQQGFYLGVKTNNQAEYFALLLGVFFAKKYITQKDSLTIISDSQLLVRQMNGLYKVKDIHLKKLKDLAVLWLKDYSYTIEHVLREFNVLADEMANRGVEKKVVLTQELLQCLRDHDIVI